MANTNKSSAWYRVAAVKPQLQGHIIIDRHEYHNHAWFILQDRHKARSHRFNATAYFIISCMNGQRNMQEIWQIAQTRFPEHPPSQDEMIHLLAKLYQAELVQTDSIPDIEELTQRTEQSRRQKVKQYFMNPLGMRFPLFNPDAFLNHSIGTIRPLFTKSLFHAWLGLIGIALLLMMLYWPELSTATQLHAFTTKNMFLFLLLYPLVKLLHELGHAFAIKHYGGQVTEMGIMLMVFVPVPYVNAHSAMSFPDKYQRMLVSAMGIIVESTLSVFALLLWLNIEPGLLRTICLDVMLIGGISTLLINGNPLLKFDGYHVLSDASESPNLASRAKKQLSYKLHYWLFKIENSDDGIFHDSERKWFFGYALAAFIYRIFIILFILNMVLDKFYAVGVMLSIWMVLQQILVPAVSYVRKFASSEQVSQHSSRVYAVTGIIGLTLLIFLFVIPMPQTSSTQGIIWLSEEMQIKANSPGFIRQLLVKNNQQVSQGETLIVTEDPLLAGRVRVMEAKLKELNAKYNAKRGQHLDEEKLKQEVATAKAELKLFRQRLTSLTLSSPADGKIVIPDHTDLLDQFVQQGQVLGFILEPNYIVAQIIISEQEISLFKQDSSVFEIRPVGQVDRLIVAHYKRLLPEAIKQLPSAALGINGGGEILVSPDDPSGRTPLQKVFQLELSLPVDDFENYIGSRVLVRVKHGNQPLAWQWGRSLQQLFLGRINV